MKRNLDLVILVGGLITLGIISDNYNRQKSPSADKSVEILNNETANGVSLGVPVSPQQFLLRTHSAVSNRYLSNVRSNNYNGN